MPDTSRARSAIREAYERHRDVMGGMSMAMLKLEAAAGFLAAEIEREKASGLFRPEEIAALPYPEDSPVWIEHASAGIASALNACDALRSALMKAGDEVAHLAAKQ